MTTRTLALAGSILTALVASTASVALAQPAETTAEQPATTEQELPAPEEIFARHVEAMGGEEAIRKMQSRTGRGTFEMSGLKSIRRLSVWAEAPDKLRYRIEDPIAGGVVDICTDGDVVWESTGEGPRRLTGSRRSDFIEAAQFYGEADYATKYTEMTTRGEAMVNNDPCWAVMVKSEEGRTRLLFFSKASGLFVAERTNVAVQGPNGRIVQSPVQVLLQDYKEVEGVKWPMTQITNYLGGERGEKVIQSIVTRLRSLEINAEGFDQEFTPPADLPPAEESEDSDSTEG